VRFLSSAPRTPRAVEKVGEARRPECSDFVTSSKRIIFSCRARFMWMRVVSGDFAAQVGALKRRQYTHTRRAP
jgi:hypothetical protein